MNQLVFIQSDQVLTDSLTIAEMFDKRHDIVLRDVRQTIKTLNQLNGSKEVEDLGIDMGVLEFVETHYINEQNKQSYPKFLLNFDAFMLVTMSYTTKKSMLIKVKYINEFNRMKQELDKQKQPFQLPTTYKEALLQLVEKEEQNEKLQLENKMLEQLVSEYEPKATYLDEILRSKGAVTISQIAEDYGMTGQAMNKLLNKVGVQYKINDQWLLYSKHKGHGYTKSNTVDVNHKDGSKSVKMHTCWTQKGRLFIYETLKKQSVFPLMDIEINNIKLVSGS